MTTGFTGCVGIARDSTGGADAVAGLEATSAAGFFPQPAPTKTSPLMDRPQTSFKYELIFSELIESQHHHNGGFVTVLGALGFILQIGYRWRMFQHVVKKGDSKQQPT